VHANDEAKKSSTPNFKEPPHKVALFFDSFPSFPSFRLMERNWLTQTKFPGYRCIKVRKELNN
jgi:hypothetical protein